MSGKSFEHDKSTEVRVMERRQQVTDLVMRGLSYAKIGKEVGVSAMQVCRDVKECVEEWRRNYLQDIDTIKGREVARIEHLLARLWEDFEISRWRTIPAKLDSKGKPVKGPQGKERQVRVVGSMEVIKEIRGCIDALWRIYGIGEQNTTNNTTVNVFEPAKVLESLQQARKLEEQSKLAQLEQIVGVNRSHGKSGDDEQLVEVVNNHQVTTSALITITDDMSPLQKLEALRHNEKVQKGEK